ncbi:MAG: TIGR02147 family protein [Bdellovibrio sp.]
MVSVYEFADYKLYLKKFIANSDQRGFTTRLAEAAGCQRSYFSTVLNGSIHLLPEHIFGISEFLELSNEEQEYLFLVLDHNRAGNPAFRTHLLKKIREKQLAWKDFKNRLKRDTILEAEDISVRQFYYTSWLYAAIHIAVSIPKLGDIKNLSSYLGITEATSLWHLEHLSQMGLVEKKGGRWAWKSGDLHLSKDSPWIGNHHSNWRMQALSDLAQKNAEALHFSVVQSLSKEDIEALRFRIVEWVEEFKKRAGPSNPEELICLNIDFFKPGPV